MRSDSAICIPGLIHNQMNLNIIKKIFNLIKKGFSSSKIYINSIDILVLWGGALLAQYYLSRYKMSMNQYWFPQLYTNSIKIESA